MATKFVVPLKQFDFSRDGISGQSFVPGLKDASGLLAVYEFQDYQADRLAQQHKAAIVNMQAELVSDDPVVQGLYDEMLAKIAEHRGEVPVSRLDPANLVEGIGVSQAPVFMNQHRGDQDAAASAPPDANVLAELNGEPAPAAETPETAPTETKQAKAKSKKVAA